MDSGNRMFELYICWLVIWAIVLHFVIKYWE